MALLITIVISRNLTLFKEEDSGTNPSASDTDDDGLTDGNENLTLMTDPTLEDTDGDNLADGWEVRYNGTPGVNPLVAATADELASDLDDDGLNLAEEFKANTDPTTADNLMITMMNTTKPNVSSNETNGILSFTLLVVVSIFISLGVTLVVYRVRKRML